jgi:hypothetical protein
LSLQLYTRGHAGYLHGSSHSHARGETRHSRYSRQEARGSLRPGRSLHSGGIRLGSLHDGAFIVILEPAAALVSFNISLRNSLHTINLYFNISATRQRIGDLIDRLFVNLHAMNGEARPSVKFLVANVTLEMLGLLMLDQNLLVVEFSVAVPAPRLTLLLLLSSHSLLV